MLQCILRMCICVMQISTHPVAKKKKTADQSSRNYALSLILLEIALASHILE